MIDDNEWGVAMGQPPASRRTTCKRPKACAAPRGKGPCVVCSPNHGRSPMKWKGTQETLPSGYIFKDFDDMGA